MITTLILSYSYSLAVITALFTHTLIVLNVVDTILLLLSLLVAFVASVNDRRGEKKWSPVSLQFRHWRPFLLSSQLAHHLLAHHIQRVLFEHPATSEAY